MLVRDSILCVSYRKYPHKISTICLLNDGQFLWTCKGIPMIWSLRNLFKKLLLQMFFTSRNSQVFFLKAILQGFSFPLISFLASTILVFKNTSDLCTLILCLATCLWYLSDLGVFWGVIRIFFKVQNHVIFKQKYLDLFFFYIPFLFLSYLIILAKTLNTVFRVMGMKNLALFSVLEKMIFPTFVQCQLYICLIQSSLC